VFEFDLEIGELSFIARAGGDNYLRGQVEIFEKHRGRAVERRQTLGSKTESWVAVPSCMSMLRLVVEVKVERDAMDDRRRCPSGWG